jgi:hypothetical protein
VPLTERQSSIVTGTLLGDGSMRCKLQAFVSSPPRLPAGNGTRIAYRFTTRSLSEFTPTYRLFYRVGKKIVPDVAISPLALAVWFMDDGSRSRTSVYLNAQQFAVREQLRLIDLLGSSTDSGLRSIRTRRTIASAFELKALRDSKPSSPSTSCRSSATNYRNR